MIIDPYQHLYKMEADLWGVIRESISIELRIEQGFVKRGNIAFNNQVIMENGCD